MANLEMTERFILVDIQPSKDPRWDSYVGGHQKGSIYHHSAWINVLTKTYGHKVLHLGLVSLEDGLLRGILPLVYVCSPLMGKRIVSLPFTSYCNPLFPENHLEEAFRFAFRRFRGAKFIELRQLSDDYRSDACGRQVEQSQYVCQILPLEGDIEDLFLSFHQSCVRRRIRNAERSRLSFRLGFSESDLLRFYELFVGVRKKHGLPPAPYKFFSHMHHLLAPLNLIEIPVIEFGGKIVAAAVILKSRSTWHLEYIAADPLFNRMSPTQLLLWNCIKRAHGKNMKFFDFGRTALWHHSLLTFKDRWHTLRHKILHRYFPEDIKPPMYRNYSYNILARINRIIPPFLLKLEGRLIYPHMH